MLIISRRTAICQPVAEVSLTGVAPLGAVSHRINFILLKDLNFFIVFFIFTVLFLFNFSRLKFARS